MLDVIRPEIDEMWFRENLMGDEETMSYNTLQKKTESLHYMTI